MKRRNRFAGRPCPACSRILPADVFQIDNVALCECGEAIEASGDALRVIPARELEELDAVIRRAFRDLDADTGKATSTRQH